MPILIVLTLVPALSFYVYALLQFVMEAKRRRLHDTCAVIVPLHSIRQRDEEQISRPLDEAPSRAAAEYQSAPVSRPAAKFGRNERTTRAAVVAAYLKNRLAARHSGAGPQAARHAAKG